MTIQYYVGGKIVGLEADIKPTGVPVNTTFIESDTFKEFIFDGVVTWNQIISEPVGFLPSDVAGLKLWLDAGVGVVSSLGVVSSWADQSGENNDVSQGTENEKPILDPTALNGLPVISFDGVDDFLLRSTYTGGEIPQGLTQYIVATRLPDGSGRYADAGDQSTRTMTFNQGSPLHIAMFSGSATIEGTLAVPSGFSILKMEYNGASSSAEIGGVDAGISGNPGTSGMNGVVLAAAQGGLSAFGLTSIAEMLVYDSILATQDADDLLAYFQNKYAL